MTIRSKFLKFITIVVPSSFAHDGFGQQDFFLKIEGVKGSSTADGFKDQIEVIDFSYGAYSNIDQSIDPPRQTGNPSVYSISFFLNMDGKTYPKLFERMVQGTYFPLTDILFTASRNLGGERVTTMEIKIAGIIDSVSHSGSQGDSSYVYLLISPSELNIKAWEIDPKTEQPINPTESTWKAVGGK